MGLFLISVTLCKLISVESQKKSSKRVKKNSRLSSRIEFFYGLALKIEDEIVLLKQKLRDTELTLKKEQSEKCLIEYKLKQQQEENDQQMRNIINRQVIYYFYFKVF